MSAAEKLKALDAAMTKAEKPWLASVEEIAVSEQAISDLASALPQIVAVVEAAEAIVQAEDDWDVYAKTPALDEALSALDESLGTNRPQ